MINADRVLLPWHWLRAERAWRRARDLGLPGLEFDRFGRKLGWRMGWRGMRGKAAMLLHPVVFLRYYEFSFVAESLRDAGGNGLDVSSPFLFSLWLTATRPDWRVRISNPDARDSAATAAIVRRLGLERIDVSDRDAEALAAEGLTYDAIWSISVFEHIAGDGDGRALRALAACLRPGGRLCLTVMCAPSYTEEFVDEDVYGLGRTRTDRGHFFQRFYDETALRERLLDAVPGLSVVRTRWIGETRPGSYAAYAERARRGLRYAWAVEEPLIAAREYQWFERFADLPGVGAACLELRKSA
ncbi:MAG TPA: class I SAM-dependent methyltransferase [Opitutus sp.]|nr:class I SAM-dependent methyltransferase [Opitutus sp.]